MMGERRAMQESLFYEFRLEEHVPPDHLLRRIDRFVDCTELRQHLASFYSTTGRPSVDPELMIRMLLVGYCLGIRSERRLCEEVGSEGFAVDASLIQADANKQRSLAGSDWTAQDHTPSRRSRCRPQIASAGSRART